MGISIALRSHVIVSSIILSSIGSSIGCESLLMKRRSQVRIFPYSIFAWTYQKKNIYIILLYVMFYNARQETHLNSNEDK
jgi:hypothetical protein